MPITQKDVKGAFGESPVDKDFAQAERTLGTYKELKATLTSYNQEIFGNIYGDPQNWNPAGVVGFIGKYSGLVNETLKNRKSIVEADSLLGPKLLDYLTQASLAVVAQKNAALPWAEYIRDRTVFGKVQSEMAAERGKALGKQIPELENLIKQLHNIK